MWPPSEWIMFRSFQWVAILLVILDVMRLVPCHNLFEHTAPKVDTKILLNDTAACLLLFDDNHYLVEWLAYQYHALNMRQLIVVTDPRSKTSPLDVLERWQGLIDYEVWDETRVFPPGKLDRYRAKNDLIKLHRARQGYFYSECLRELKSRGSEWVAFLDVDEYIFPNAKLSDPKHALYRPFYQYNPVAGYVLDFLKKESHVPACYHMARRDFIAKDSPLELVSEHVPPGLEATDLSTARWLYRTDRLITGKCLVNANAIVKTSIPDMAPKQGHVVLPRICPSARDAKHNYHMDNSPLVIHHYLGSKEQYLFREDPRMDRTADYLDFKAKGPLTLVDHASQWIPHFVQAVGLAEAQRLLDGAGKVAGAT